LFARVTDAPAVGLAPLFRLFGRTFLLPVVAAEEDHFYFLLTGEQFKESVPHPAQLAFLKHQELLALESILGGEVFAVLSSEIVPDFEPEVFV